EILSQGPRRFLAYDVISALKLGALLEDLLSCSERDQSGFAYHAVNALVVAANRERIAAIYLSRAVASRTSDASRMVLLDSLGRLGHALKVSDLEKLLRSPSPELRSAALYHVRHFLVHWSHEDFLPLVGKALLSSDRALRMQALKLVTELSPVLWRRARPLLQSCASDPDEEIRGACGKASSR
ncbi:MAG: HEAT repeat domain-containing protein, partial [Bdellovibrionota bacterium]